MTGPAARARGVGAAARRRGGGAPHVPTYIIGIRARVAPGTSNVVGTLTGVASGDVLLAFVSTQAAAILTPPAGAGWSLIGDSGNSIGGEVGRMWVYATTATSSGQSGGTWTWDTSTGHLVEVVAYRYVVVPTVASTGRADGVSKQVVAPTRTSLTSGAIAVRASIHSSGGITPTWTGAMTQRLAASSSTIDGTVYDEIITPAGASGTRTYSVSASTPGPMSAATVILEAA